MYKPNLEKLNKKLKSIGSGKYFKLAEGDNKIRILPPTKKDQEFYLEVTLHYGFTDGERERAYPCLDAMKNQSCPACTLWRKAQEEGEEDVARKVMPKTSYLSNIVDRSDNTIHVWSYNGKMLKSIINYIMDEDYGPEILDPEKGRDFTINREGQGIKTRYKDPRISPKPKPVGVDDWEEKVTNLENEIEFIGFSDYVNFIEDQYADYVEEWGLTFKKGAKANGRSEEAEEEDDEGEDDRSAKSKSRSKGDEDDDEIEDEDREERSSKGTKGTKKPSPSFKGKGTKPVKDSIDEEDDDDDIEELDDEEDEEDFLMDEDEEEIEDAPKPKAKKKGKKK